MTATARHEAMTRWAALAVLLLYPGFFLYHAAVGILGLPAVLGGYYGTVSAALLTLAAAAALPALLRGHTVLGWLDLGFLALCGLVAAWSLAYHRLGAPYQRESALLAQSFAMIGLWSVNYLAFRHLDLGTPLLRWGLALAAAAVVAIVLAHQVDGLFQPSIASTATAERLVATYQGFARSAFVVFLCLLATARAGWLPWILGIGLATLVVLGARSEFLGFILAGGTIAMLRLRDLRPHHVLLPALVACWWLWAGIEWPISGNVRISNLANLASDGSYLTRMELTRHAWRTVRGAPLLGDYGSYVLVGGLGSYAHNALSAWVNFGFAGFLAFGWMMGVSCRRALLGVGGQIARQPQALFAVGLVVHLVLMAFTAKALMYPLFAAGWGAAAGLVRIDRKRRDAVPSRVDGVPA
ncbi:MAG: hypothetical protein ACREMH_11940 [Gemmatimonadales bacterium]